MSNLSMCDLPLVHGQTCLEKHHTTCPTNEWILCPLLVNRKDSECFFHGGCVDISDALQFHGLQRVPWVFRMTTTLPMQGCVKLTSEACNRSIDWRLLFMAVNSDAVSDRHPCADNAELRRVEAWYASHLILLISNGSLIHLHHRKDCFLLAHSLEFLYQIISLSRFWLMKHLQIANWADCEVMICFKRIPCVFRNWVMHNPQAF